MNPLYCYLALGVGFYIGLALKDPTGFIEATAASLLRGVLIGIFFWPIGMILEVIMALENLKPPRKKTASIIRNIFDWLLVVFLTFFILRVQITGKDNEKLKEQWITFPWEQEK